LATCTVTLDTRAFESEMSARPVQRGQRTIRGNIAIAGTYTSGGDACDLRGYFPLSSTKNEVRYKVLLSPDGVYIPIYDHDNRKLKLYTAMNAEASGSVSATFPFIAVGE